MTRAAIIFAAAPVNDALIALVGMFLAFAFGLWWGWRALARR